MQADRVKMEISKPTWKKRSPDGITVYRAFLPLIVVTTSLLQKQWMNYLDTWNGFEVAYIAPWPNLANHVSLILWSLIFTAYFSFVHLQLIVLILRKIILYIRNNSY